MMKEYFEKLLTAVYPKRCGFCGCVIEFDKTLCDDCRLAERISPPLCPSCGSSGEDCCCKKHKMEYKSVIAPFYYTDRVVTAVHRLKFNNMPWLAKQMGTEMAETVQTCYDSVVFDYVTFVPMSRLRRYKRGYNQAELLAAAVAERCNLICLPALKKVRHNKVQRKQSARERKVNVYGAFDLNADADVQDKTILLVDDVKTTGATINECAKMLKIYGAKEVYCVTLAVTNKKTCNPS